jgi:hypothetical protein
VESLEDWKSGRAHQLVADTIRYFLSPVCPHCLGRKRKVINGRAIGPECQKCGGTGERVLDHGGRGRALLQHMKACAATAAADLREGAYGLRRPDTSTERRERQRSHERIDDLRRADAEAKADEKQDSAAVAERFRESMTKPERLRRARLAMFRQQNVDES